MTLVSSRAAVATALSYARHRTRFRSGMCDHVVAMENGLSYSGYATAAAHFHAIPLKYRHGTAHTPPPGALVFWTGGSSGAGHIVLSVGQGMCASTDIVASGYVNIVRINYITSKWGQHYVGWTDAYYGRQGVRIVSTSPAVTTPPKVSLSAVQHAAHVDPSAPQGHRTAPLSVFPVERGLRSEGFLPVGYVDGSYGTSTIAAYKKWQQKLGYSGGAADGIPGRISLTKLGERHGFVVVA